MFDKIISHYVTSPWSREWPEAVFLLQILREVVYYSQVTAEIF
nr:MAG TPA: hypothetical protein [Caudoviricetes sp.]